MNLLFANSLLLATVSTERRGLIKLRRTKNVEYTTKDGSNPSIKKERSFHISFSIFLSHKRVKKRSKDLNVKVNSQSISFAVRLFALGQRSFSFPKPSKIPRTKDMEQEDELMKLERLQLRLLFLPLKREQRRRLGQELI